MPVSPGPLANWSDLTETVRPAHRPPRSTTTWPVLYRPLVAGTFTTIFRCASCADLAALHCTRRRVLDPRRCSTVVVRDPRRNPTATAVERSSDGVVDLAEDRLAEHGTGPRRDPGRRLPRLRIDVEDDTYDIVVLGHVLRAESDERARAPIDLAARAEARRAGARRRLLR
ncbi:MAG: hypothetical protein R2697_08430 [Ilumatobacteraceae bacterium]